jgi:hypothetical protein
LASQRAADAGASRSAAVHDALVRKAQEKAAADVEAFKAQQRRAVAATVEIQRADSARAAEKDAAVRAARAAAPVPAYSRVHPQAQREPKMTTFLDPFGKSAR